MALPHRVTPVELADWMDEELSAWKRFAFSSGAGADKRLEVNLGRDLYRVIDHGAICYEGPDQLAAIDAYNEAR